MKYALLLSLLPLLLTCSKSKPGEIIKVEHVYVSLSNAPAIFGILKDQFGWPVVWDYQDWGTFESGGLSLGNAVLEVMMPPAEKPEKRYGIALAPSGSASQFVSILDAGGIAHGPQQKTPHWSIVTLEQFVPQPVDLFLCDYHDRSRVQEERQAAAANLQLLQHNPLGILQLQEIVINTKEPLRFETEWAKLPGMMQCDNHFVFTEGPAVKFMAADQFSLSLRIEVQSLQKTKMELETLGFKTVNNPQGLQLTSDELGLQIYFIE